MGWYTDTSKRRLDYSKPIATNFHGKVQLLLPQIKKEDYKIIGYNWFNMDDGTYGSSRMWETPDCAVEARLEKGHEVYNVDINLTRVY